MYWEEVNGLLKRNAEEKKSVIFIDGGSQGLKADRTVDIVKSNSDNVLLIFKADDYEPKKMIISKASIFSWTVNNTIKIVTPKNEVYYLTFKS